MPVACPIGRGSAVNHGRSRTRHIGAHQQWAGSGGQVHDLCKHGVTNRDRRFLVQQPDTLDHRLAADPGHGELSGYAGSVEVGDGEDEKRRERALQIIGNVAAAGAGQLLGGPVGAMAAAAGSFYLVDLARKVWDEVRPDQQRRAAEMLDAAAKAAGRKDEDLERLIMASERTRLLAFTAIDAAARTAWPPRVRALGRALAEGLLLQDDALVDVPQFALVAMADLEAPHVALLNLFSYSRRGGLTIKAIGQYRPQLRVVAPGLVGVLQRHGLIMQNDNLSETIEYYTELYDNRMEDRLNGLARNVQSGIRGFPKMPKVSGDRIAPEQTYSITPLGVRVLGFYREAGTEIESAQTETPEADGNTPI